MDTDRAENIKEFSTLEGACGCDESLEENSHITNEEFEECCEHWSINRTEKGLEFNLEIGRETTNIIEGPPIAYEHYL